MVNVDIFSNRVNHWSDLYTNGWNLTWAIGGSLEILEISGLLGIIVRSVLQAIFHLTENLRGAVRWLEQIVQQCDKALLFETIGGVLADWLFISYSGLNQKPEQTILWAIVFGTLWIIAWTIIRLFVCIRKKLLAEVREISIQSSFSIIGEGLILIGLGTETDKVKEIYHSIIDGMCEVVEEKVVQLRNRMPLSKKTSFKVFERKITRK